ncbi:TPR end-of-group domain-containing protein [Paremcibacter congregatus]|uniref:Uncharacterized protein n=1 Tax=Paremcibacter congregatus TaxID=2043170 RepID=A0A2G4YSL6_9PROT|nr:tetratricopeptide repeat protein [Paremcibacter congregatus]PHZ85250.1 hypothetical protein CRD36_07540 [Paremcibacter congregatus]QDE27818.1 tetratricopeptide repeat protein [Paremcibacter congregatus]|tara:strand:+ start:3272 stop:4159 length:888 start_codon:yes stop_codon:yes gene_type:complete
MLRILLCGLIISLFSLSVSGGQEKDPKKVEQDVAQRKAQVEKLEKPLYTPFIERYMLDELKQLRTEMAAQRVDLMKQILDREHSSVDRGVSYATDAVTYFFYLIAGAISILVLVGWSSIRDMKERVHLLADEEISKLVHTYEERLRTIEEQMNQKAQNIEENREEIELTNEIQSLWLRAAQESNLTNRATIYDQVLRIRPDDCEALTYKADTVLEMGEPQWAANLCHRALAIDPEYSQAFYQLACVYTALNQFDEAVRYLSEALKRAESYREEVTKDPALKPLADYEAFQELINH